MTMPLIADGVRVVEVSDYVFVPVAGAVLASMGADVIKVERQGTGDAMRAVGAGRDGVGVAPANLGKRSIAINLESDEGRQVFESLVKGADVFITNRTGPVARKLRIGLEDIRALNPNIIYAHGTAHGSQGPEGDRGGFDTSDFWYRGGVAAATHVPDAALPPGLPAPGFGDLTGGHHLAAGVVGALYHRERTGEALSVEVSLLGAALWSLGYGISLASNTGQLRPQSPSGPPDNALHSVYRTGDGRFVNITARDGLRYFPEFCAIFGLDEVAKDGRFSTQEGFAAGAGELTEVIGRAFASLTYDEALERMASFSGQWGPVQNVVDVVSDRQVLANGYLADGSTPGGRPYKLVRPPIQYNGGGADLRPAPLFNQHRDEILVELGLSDDEIAALTSAGAVT